jgi:hypothetical protein
MHRAIFTTLIMFLLSVTAFAADGGFETEEISGAEKEQLYETCDIAILPLEPTKRRIEQFDVYEDGSFAVVSRKWTTIYVSVYNENAEYQYGFSFTSYGSVAVELQSESILVYRVRSHTIVEVNSDGEIVDIVNVLDTHENNLYSNDLLHRDTVQTGDKTYRSEGKSLNLFSGYARLVIEDDDGNEKVLYEVDPPTKIEKIRNCFIILVFIILFIRAFRIIRRQSIFVR